MLRGASAPLCPSLTGIAPIDDDGRQCRPSRATPGSRARARALRALGARQHAGVGAVVAAGRRRTNLPRCQDVPADDYHANARSFAPRRDARASGWSREALPACATRCSPRATTTASRCSTRKQSDFSIATRPTTATSCASTSRRRAPPGCRSASTTRSADWHHPDYPPFTDADRPYRFGIAPKPTDEQWAALPRLPVRAAPRAAHQLRHDRPDLVRRRLGAQRRRVALAELGDDDPRAAARRS